MTSGVRLPTEGETEELPHEPLMENPPEAIRALMAQYLDLGETPEVVVAADMTPDGRYGEAWMMVTEKRVIIVNPDHGVPEGWHIRLADLERIEKQDFVGSSSLRLVGGGGACELRFSLTNAEKFADVHEIIEALRHQLEEGGAGNGARSPHILTREALRKREEARAREKGVCPKCGRTLPRWSRVCPVCLQTKQLLMRLVPFIRPYWLLLVLNLVLMLFTTSMTLAPPC